MLDKIALTLLIIGGINWGLVGLSNLTSWPGSVVDRPALSAESSMW